MSSITDLTDRLKEFRKYEFYLLNHETQKNKNVFIDKFFLTFNGVDKSIEFINTIEYTFNDELKTPTGYRQLVETCNEIYQRLRKIEQTSPLICSGFEYFNEFMIKKQLKDVYCTNLRIPGLIEIGNIRTK